MGRGAGVRRHLELRTGPAGWKHACLCIGHARAFAKARNQAPTNLRLDPSCREGRLVCPGVPCCLLTAPWKGLSCEHVCPCLDLFLH